MWLHALRKRFNSSSFLSALLLIKRQKKLFASSLLLDYLFLGATLLAGSLVGKAIPQDAESLVAYFGSQTNALVFALAYPLLYYIFLIFLYSIAKLGVLLLIERMHGKKNLRIEMLWKFFLNNLAIFGIFAFGAAVIAGLFGLLFEREFLKNIVFVLSIPFILYLYALINIAHSFFVRDHGGQGIVVRAIHALFSKVKKFGVFLFWDILLGAFFYFLYFLMHLFFTKAVFFNQAAVNALGSYYSQWLAFLSSLFLYLIIGFNRIYFYERVEAYVEP
ncbi:hypothetical protein HYU13_03485 [Candidatus Woesearchaeota archaeon]|nr:hypothetical protein [Candidatus Woesearchaeota archaeon]